ncbi:MAG: hypothetical protein ACJAXF_003103 [Polaribacter sp.]|jgi:hypothetical protein
MKLAPKGYSEASSQKKLSILRCILSNLFYQNLSIFLLPGSLLH